MSFRWVDSGGRRQLAEFRDGRYMLCEDWASWDESRDQHGGELVRRVRQMQPGERLNARNGGYIRRLPRPDLAGNGWESGAGGVEANRHASPEEAIGQIVGREGARFDVGQR